MKVVSGGADALRPRHPKGHFADQPRQAPAVAATVGPQVGEERLNVMPEFHFHKKFPRSAPINLSARYASIIRDERSCPIAETPASGGVLEMDRGVLFAPRSDIIIASDERANQKSGS